MTIHRAETFHTERTMSLQRIFNLPFYRSDSQITHCVTPTLSCIAVQNLFTSSRASPLYWICASCR